MIRFSAKILWLLLLLGVCPLVRGQVSEPGAATNVTAQLMPPVPKSPIASFRELLAMKPEQREAVLAARPPENRRSLEKKISEYEAMNPAERNSILVATELRWYLEYFLHVPAAYREQQLASVPEPYHQIVADRVHIFTILPPDLQKDVLEHKTTAGYFLGPGAVTPPPVPPPMPLLPPRPLADVGRLPIAERQQMYETFQHFFELGDAEREAVLQTLPDARRQQVEKMMKFLEQLPKEQRAQGLDAIGKLVLMDGRQQREFFANAARWKELSATERAAWLKLLPRLPPMPPGAGLPRPPLPGASGLSAATNSP